MALCYNPVRDKPPGAPASVKLVYWTIKNKLQWNFNRNSNISPKKIRLKMSCAKCYPIRLGLNMLSPRPGSSCRDDTTLSATPRLNDPVVYLCLEPLTFLSINVVLQLTSAEYILSTANSRNLEKESPLSPTSYWRRMRWVGGGCGVGDGFPSQTQIFFDHIHHDWCQRGKAGNTNLLILSKSWQM